MTIEEFGRRLRAREMSALDATDACLARIDADNPRLNAFILVMADEARRQAREADRELAAGRDRGPLHGVPISIKDLIDVARHADDGGVARARGTRRRARRADRRASAPGRRRLRRQDQPARVRVRHDERGLRVRSGAQSARSARSPGGSSGGSAASVVAGMALASIGTDTGGSIRIPAAACGMVGLKPTFGEVSTDGVVPLSRSLDHVGPLAASVGDALARLSRARSATARRARSSPAPVRGLRLARPARVLLRSAGRRGAGGVRGRRSSGCARRGARVRDVEIRHARDIAPIYLHIGLAEAAAYHAATLERMPELYTPPVRLRLEMGRYILAEDYVRALAWTRGPAARSGRRAGRARRARAADAADSRAADRRSIRWRSARDRSRCAT